MPFYEILFETGHMSVMNCASDDEVSQFIREHDRRAKNGEPGGPIGQPAERIAKVYIYDTHPNEYNPEQTASAEVLNTELPNIVAQLQDANGVVHIDALAQEVRGLSHPMVSHREGAFDSMYKMEPTGTLDLGFLNEPVAGGGK